jgi:FAD:protein FMN transferase
MHKWRIRILVIGLLGIVIFTLRTHMTADVYQQQGYVFGTLVDISVEAENKQQAAKLSNHIFRDFQQLHQQLHAWKSDTQGKPSELGLLNAAFTQGKSALMVSSQLAEIVVDAQTLSKQSHGLFNPAIGHLISTWGFHQDSFDAVSVDHQKIQTLVNARPSMDDIVVDGQNVYSINPQVKLDFGGYAKGYALDKAGRYLRERGVKNALINIGGNILAIGQHANKPWRVGIQHPRQPGAIATLDLDDGWAIGTSGDYQRYFMLGDQRYCHIIDPRNGYPVQHTQAVTVLIPPQHNAGVLSDVTSKPIFIAAPLDKPRAASDIGVTYFMAIDADGNVLMSKPMADKLKWLAPTFEKQHHVRIIQSH